MKETDPFELVCGRIGVSIIWSELDLLSLRMAPCNSSACSNKRLCLGFGSTLGIFLCLVPDNTWHLFWLMNVTILVNFQINGIVSNKPSSIKEKANKVTAFCI